jgi:hypothetical protein
MFQGAEIRQKTTGWLRNTEEGNRLVFSSFGVVFLSRTSQLSGGHSEIKRS